MNPLWALACINGVLCMWTSILHNRTFTLSGQYRLGTSRMMSSRASDNPSLKNQLAKASYYEPKPATLKECAKALTDPLITMFKVCSWTQIKPEKLSEESPNLLEALKSDPEKVMQVLASLSEELIPLLNTNDTDIFVKGIVTYCNKLYGFGLEGTSVLYLRAYVLYIMTLIRELPLGDWKKLSKYLLTVDKKDRYLKYSITTCRYILQTYHGMARSEPENLTDLQHSFLVTAGPKLIKFIIDANDFDSLIAGHEFSIANGYDQNLNAKFRTLWREASHNASQSTDPAFTFNRILATEKQVFEKIRNDEKLSQEEKENLVELCMLKRSSEWHAADFSDALLFLQPNDPARE